MKTSDFDYDLPPGLIAQHPLPERSQSRMLVVRRSEGTFDHCHIRDLPLILQSGDLLALNDTRVIPARILGHKTNTGGKVEVLFVEEIEPGRWRALYRASGSAKPGASLTLAGGRLSARIVEVGKEGLIELQTAGDKPVQEILQEHGMPPLPPYIKRPDGPSQEDKARYQTVYAMQPGAVAAPTAGLHFSTDLLTELAHIGVKRATVTLHVGIGTFKPVTTESVDDHRMDAERFIVTEEAAALVNETRRAGGRIVAVGSTTVRALESAAGETGAVTACEGLSSLFIRPPYQFRIVNAMLTNFHLPKSTLLMMVSAMAGRENILRAYRKAIEQEYRFYSYGDCMLIL